jgi:hypothetical protein
LKDVKGVKAIKSVEAEKRLEVEYLEAQSPLSKLAQAILTTDPLHGETYVGILALKVEGLTQDNLMKVEEAFAKIKGVHKPALDTKDKNRVLTVTFKPNMGDVKLMQLLDALKAAGFKAEAYIVEKK